MASLVANDVRPVVVAVEPASPVRVAVTRHAARPARSATLVRIAGLAVLCAATLVAPALLLVWMPIVLGVPHIASDIRFLVLTLPRRQVVLSIVACAALVVLKAASLVGGMSLVGGIALARGEAIVVAVWLLGLLALAGVERRGAAQRGHALQRHVAARSNPRPSSLAWITAAVAGMAIIALPLTFAVFAAFAHNIVAVIAWIVVKRPERRHALAVIAAIAAALGVLIIAGPVVANVTGGDASPWLTVDKAARAMFGGIALPTARALMIAFAFMQAVHYAIWLDWVPRGSARMPTKSWMAVAAGTLAVIAAALVDAKWARTTYLALATFHVYLELVILAARFAGRVPRFAGSERQCAHGRSVA